MPCGPGIPGVFPTSAFQVKVAEQRIAGDRMKRDVARYKMDRLLERKVSSHAVTCGRFEPLHQRSRS